jgi:hypothetical protein
VITSWLPRRGRLDGRWIGPSGKIVDNIDQAWRVHSQEVSAAK